MSKYKKSEICEVMKLAIVIPVGASKTLADEVQKMVERGLHKQAKTLMDEYYQNDITLRQIRGWDTLARLNQALFAFGDSDLAIGFDFSKFSWITLEQAKEVADIVNTMGNYYPLQHAMAMNLVENCGENKKLSKLISTKKKLERINGILGF